MSDNTEKFPTNGFLGGAPPSALVDNQGSLLRRETRLHTLALA